MSERTGTYEIRLGSQGRLVIPAALREQMGADEGSVYVASIDPDGALRLQTRDRALAAMRRRWSAAAGDRDLVAELREERGREAAAE